MGSLMSSRLSVNSDLLIQLDSAMPQAVARDLIGEMQPIMSQEDVWSMQGLLQMLRDETPDTRNTNAICHDLEEFLLIQDSFIASLRNGGDIRP